jgi:SAM-dependent methyltransferase
MNSVHRAFNTVCKSIEKNAWFGVLLAAVMVLLLVSVRNKLNQATVRPYSGSFIESFVQSSSSKVGADLIVKRDADTKDAFYASVYDDLFNQKVNNAYEVGELVNAYPDITTQAIALDVGAGTGAYMNAFIQNGITNVTGIESSSDMVAQAKRSYPGMNIVKGNPAAASAFKPDSFTLVSVLNFEVYHIPNTEQLFSNLYAWLKPGGYFVLHLVDPRRFNAASMLGGESANPARNKAHSAAKFNDFDYTSDVQVFPNDMVQYMEVFTDEKTGKVRKNVRNFKLPPPHEFIALATGAGFNMLGQIDLVKAGKEYQYFYLFYKPAN